MVNFVWQFGWAMGQIFGQTKVLSVSVFFFLFFFKFIYFWLYWVFVARGLSLVVASRGYSLLRCVGFSLWWLLVAEHGL